MRNADRKAHQVAKKLRRETPEAEEKLWSELRAKRLNGFHFRRQHPIGRFVADFACVKEKLVVEIDGWTHSTEAEQASNTERTRVIEKLGWTIIRFTNDDVYNELENVLRTIYMNLPSTAVAGEVAPQGSEGAAPLAVDNNG